MQQNIKTVKFAAALFYVFFSQICLAATSATTLRVAVLDNLQVEPLGSYYQQAYIEGIETAALAAKKQNINIVYKTFWFNSEPLDILKKVPEVKAWAPDLVLGPHYSNDFLLLKDQFTNVLVLSLYASDKDLVTLPNNFYSLYLPDPYAAQALSNFINKRFPERDVFTIVQADCKDCVDMSELFASTHKKSNPARTVERSMYINDNIEDINIKELMKNYKPGQLIILEPIDYYSANKIIGRIVNELKQKDLIFLNLLDNWGGQRLENIYRINTSVNYERYRIAPLYFDKRSTRFKEFSNFFTQKFHAPPQDTISYVAYMTVMSAVTAFRNFPVSGNELNTSQKFLASYQLALAKDPNWFRTKIYVAYKLGPKGEVEAGTVSFTRVEKPN